jgi:hypothetical protein
MDSDGSIFCASAGGSDGAGGETGGVRQADRRKVNKPQKIAAFAFAEIVSFIFDAPTRRSSYKILCRLSISPAMPMPSNAYPFF